MIKKLVIAFIIGLMLAVFYTAIGIEAKSLGGTEEYQCPMYGDPNVYYPTGLHQIYGEQDQREGEDKVYYFGESGEDGALQCFCPSTGEGIQTIWTKSPASPEKVEGTVNGIDWGLQDAPYLAVNSSYNCEVTPTMRKRCREWANQFGIPAMVLQYERLCEEAIEGGGW